MKTERTIKQLEYAKQFHKLNDLVIEAIDNSIEHLMKSEEKCYWILSTVLDYVVWFSDCGLDWQFSNPETPIENEMHYCPKCGKKLEVAE